MTRANEELNLQELDQVSGGWGNPNGPAPKPILWAFEQRFAAFESRMMPPSWRDPIFS
jgi:hypothetical protein